MRILFVSTSLGKGGAEKQLLYWVRGLRAKGHEIGVVSLTHTNSPLTRWEQESRISIFPWKKLGLIKTSLELNRLSKAWRPDVTVGLLFHGNVFARLGSGLRGVPVLNLERSSNYPLKFRRRLALWLTRPLLARVAANSQRGIFTASHRYLVPASRIPVLPNGVENLHLSSSHMQRARGKVRKLFKGNKEHTAIMVGTWKEAKDHFLAISVAEALTRQAPHWGVLFVGRDGREGTPTKHHRAVWARLRASSAARSIVTVGECEDVQELILGSDVLYLTSRYEGCPNAVLEAMSLGIPVVSTDVGDVRTLLPEPFQVIATRCPEQIAQAVLQAFKCGNLIIPAQTSYIKAHHSVNQGISSLEQLLFEMVKCQ